MRNIIYGRTLSIPLMCTFYNGDYMGIPVVQYLTNVFWVHCLMNSSILTWVYGITTFVDGQTDSSFSDVWVFYGYFNTMLFVFFCLFVLIFFFFFKYVAFLVAFLICWFEIGKPRWYWSIFSATVATSFLKKILNIFFIAVCTSVFTSSSSSFFSLFFFFFFFFACEFFSKWFVHFVTFIQFPCLLWASSPGFLWEFGAGIGRRPVPFRGSSSNF